MCLTLQGKDENKLKKRNDFTDAEGTKKGRSLAGTAFLQLLQFFLNEPPPGQMVIQKGLEPLAVIRFQ